MYFFLQLFESTFLRVVYYNIILSYCVLFYACLLLRTTPTLVHTRTATRKGKREMGSSTAEEIVERSEKWKGEPALKIFVAGDSSGV